MKKKTLLAFTVFAALFCMLAASCSNAVPKGGEVVISFSSQELKAAVNSASRQAGSTYTLSVWLEVNGQPTKVQEQSIADIESSEDKSFSFGEFEVGSKVIAYAKLVMTTEKGEVLLMAGSSGEAKTITEGDNPLEITMQYEGPGIGTISLTVRFLLEGDDGNYDLDPDIQPVFIELGFDEIEEFNSVTLNDYEGVNEQLLKIIDMGYVLNEEKTFAEENEPDFTKEYVVMNFFFDKEGGFSTDVEYNGEIVINENKGLDISLEYDRDDIYLNQGTFTLHPKEANGTELWEEVREKIEWDVKLLYNGKDVNTIDPGCDDYYLIDLDEDYNANLIINHQSSLPMPGSYLIYVVASVPGDSSDSAVSLYSSQTFDISVPDRHIFSTTDNVNVMYGVSVLHNAFITGDVTEEMWESWSWQPINVLNALFTLYTDNLQSIVFEGTFDSPNYDNNNNKSPLWQLENGIQFNNEVSLIFNNKAFVGNYLFSRTKNLKSVTFTTEVSYIGENSFSGCYQLDTLVLDGVCTIDSYAFSSCNGLSSITIPATVTTIGESAFAGCNLSSVTFTLTNGWHFTDNGERKDANVEDPAENARRINEGNNISFDYDPS